ncbi:hypothetical protein CXG81DRAFT_15687 [Caulochytrium protostelioides]|uniref:Isocitrate dehydrogenase [NAD] subunit 1, mitochondrial n=1 Tax=Caulochytrium protostelioides TaxID=1555241 RepID=A0A4P9WYM7_9FUNG|nr:hypothetical protein CXG81DRAFT_15687 [Caulochytrium protostelioides]|eukprot:RKO98611.1 hypothetical protein CXG81DRAFT_15687 [Caulochytrium protostelioides]
MFPSLTAAPRHPTTTEGVVAEARSKRYGGVHTVTLIPGDGIGQELAQAVKTVFSASGAPVHWDEYDLLSGHTPDAAALATHLRAATDSVKRNRVALKGILYTPVSVLAHRSLNGVFRKELDMYASVSLIQNFPHNPATGQPAFPTRHDNVDIAIIRENTEGEYSGLEHAPVPGVVESLKVVTLAKTRRIARFAFDFALQNGRKKVTAIHKANIMKLADGLFLKVCREVYESEYKHTGLIFEDMIVDNASMQLVSKPGQFDVVVCGNLYGTILSNVGAALVGGPGLVPGANLGAKYAVFEPGCRHVAADLAGQDAANPVGMLLSSVHLLRHLGEEQHANRIGDALVATVTEGKVLTRDLGGSAGMSAFTNEVCRKMV